MSTLVTFFSAEGTTAKVAKEYAEKIGADVFEIVPEVPYSAQDIRWMNPLARCNKEQFGKRMFLFREKSGILISMIPFISDFLSGTGQHQE